MTVVDMSCATSRMMIGIYVTELRICMPCPAGTHLDSALRSSFESLDHDLDLPHWVRAFRKQNRPW